MKFVSPFAAAALGAFLFAGGAQAAPLAASSGVFDAAAASPVMTLVDCRSVTKRVCRNGRCAVSKTRVCTPNHNDCRSVTKQSCVARNGKRVCSVVKKRVCH
jgi:hypothetical protein